MFEPTPTLTSAASRRCRLAASLSFALWAFAATGCGPLDEEGDTPPHGYEAPVDTSSNSDASSGGSAPGDEDGAGYGDDYDYDYEYEDGGSRDIAAGPGGCFDICHYAHDGECDDGGPGAVFYDCPFGTDCGDCGTRE